MARKTDNQQERYDNLLLSVIRGVDEKAVEITKEVAKQGEELIRNTIETRQSKKEIQLLKEEVTETNGSVKELQRNVTNIEKVVFPEQLPERVIHDKIESGDIRISKEAWWLIVKIVGFVGTGLAIAVGVLNG